MRTLSVLFIDNPTHATAITPFKVIKLRSPILVPIESSYTTSPYSATRLVFNSLDGEVPLGRSS